MSIIIPSSKRGIVTPHRRSFADFVGGSLNILNRQWGDAILPGPSFALAGRIKVDILDALSGIILHEGAWDHNIVLNTGLDQIASYTFANCFLYGHLSTDTATPAATDATMTGWVKRTSTYGSGDGSTTISGDVITLTRSFVFTAETSSVNYTKFYSSPTSGSSAAPFNEILFSDPVIVASGQQAKVTMSLAITATPHTTAATYSSDVISGVAGSTGTARIPWFVSHYNSHPHLCSILADGSSLSYYWPFLEPAGSAYQYLALYAAATLADASDVEPSSNPLYWKGTRSSIAPTLSAYTAGSCSRYKTFLADLADCNGTFQSVGFGSAQDGISHGFQFLSAVPFTKLNTQKLSMNFTFNWGRA
jgi:hypothetical protein